MKTERPRQSQKFFTIAQVAELLEVSTRTVRWWISLRTKQVYSGVEQLGPSAIDQAGPVFLKW
jgi:hypothetical protein